MWFGLKLSPNFMVDNHFSGWWFQTFCIFHSMTNMFQRGRSTTNQIIINHHEAPFLWSLTIISHCLIMIYPELFPLFFHISRRTQLTVWGSAAMAATPRWGERWTERVQYHYAGRVWRVACGISRSWSLKKWASNSEYPRVFRPH
jgi:hypothetical protein